MRLTVRTETMSMPWARTWENPNAVVDHNLVFQTLKASGLNDAESLTPSATSLRITAAHEKVAYISDDYYHQPRYRGTSADAGAVARQGPAPRPRRRHGP